MRVPPIAIPLLVVLAALMGLISARQFAAPSWTQEYGGGARSWETATTVMRIRGLRCVDTARTLTAQLDDSLGVSRCICYASRNEARIEYEPGRTTPEAIREAIEAPVFDAESGEFRFHQFTVLAVDGEDVDR